MATRTKSTDEQTNHPCIVCGAVACDRCVAEGVANGSLELVPYPS